MFRPVPAAVPKGAAESFHSTAAPDHPAKLNSQRQNNAHPGEGELVPILPYRFAFFKGQGEKVAAVMLKPNFEARQERFKTHRQCLAVRGFVLSKLSELRRGKCQDTASALVSGAGAFFA